MTKVRWLVLWSLWAGGLVRQPTLPVQISNGLVRGSIANDGSHISYLGIPYATYERFQAPLPNPRWRNILEATDEHISCSQRFFGLILWVQEDCLALNIYTPIEKPENLYPVMVYIHGGGFRTGSGSPFLYGPEYFVRHGVILVSLNYRLDVLGHLCLGIKEAPGNVGMKDQVESLRWIKNNIKAFGGDRNKITLFGESAGSASVLYHIVSPMSKGLFQRAIMQSASAISPWSFQFQPLETAKKLTKEMGYDLQDPNQIYELLKRQSIWNIVNTQIPRPYGDILLSRNLFVPCAEISIPNTEPFLMEHPYDLILKGQFNKLPVIIGYNNAEGEMFAGREDQASIAHFNFYDAIPKDLFLPDKERRHVAEELQKVYNSTKEDSLFVLSRFEGDTCVTYPVTATTDLLMKQMKEPVYMYKFTHVGWMNLAKYLFGLTKHPGATHADELFYMFNLRMKIPLAYLEMDMINKITKLWTNFAKYGDPTPAGSESLFKWDPITSESPHLLVLNRTTSSSSYEHMWEDKNFVFWNKTYTKYRRNSTNG